MVQIIKQYKIGHSFCLNQGLIEPEDKNTEPTIDAAVLEQIKQQAFAEGFERGKQEGLDDSMQQIQQKSQKEYQNQKEQLQQLFVQIPQQIQAHYHQLSPQVIDMVTQILPNFFVHNTIQRVNIEHAITQVIEQIDKQLSIIVKISQPDYLLLQQGKINIPQNANIKLIPCDQVQLGGCLIESEHGVFDGRLESQIDKLKQLLFNCKKQAVKTWQE